MIDAETQVFDLCAKAFLAKYGKKPVDNKHEARPTDFPALEVQEISNVEASYLHDSSKAENGSILTFEANCYSNKASGGKAEVKAIAQLVDSEMRSMGFERTFGQYLYNAADSSVHRYTTRYTGVARQTGEKDFSIYRR